MTHRLSVSVLMLQFAKGTKGDEKGRGIVDPGTQRACSWLRLSPIFY